MKLNLQMGTGHEQMNWTEPKQMNWTGHEQMNWTGHDLSLQCNNCYTKPHFVPLSLPNSIQKQLN
ncbi:hypothetical protein [Flavobacterium sp. TSSA_36]|uniref:hypothetical protein n=1 Tax=Flavobacterium sp. TSSA_36 TaxID=3447669 RepID=UPI003F2E6CED